MHMVIYVYGYICICLFCSLLRKVSETVHVVKLCWLTIAKCIDDNSYFVVQNLILFVQ